MTLQQRPKHIKNFNFVEMGENGCRKFYILQFTYKWWNLRFFPKMFEQWTSLQTLSNEQKNTKGVVIGYKNENLSPKVI